MSSGQQHDDKSLCPTCNWYNVNSPHHPSCPSYVQHPRDRLVEELQARVKHLEAALLKLCNNNLEGITELGQLIERVQKQFERGHRMELALVSAMKSLRVLSSAGGRDSDLRDLVDVRGYASSRASVAAEALLPQEPKATA